jgi:hypothetical protein
MRLVLALLLTAIALHLPGCSGGSDSETADGETVTLPTTTKVVGTTIRSEVNLQFPADWEEQSDPAPFACLWSYDPAQLTTGIFLYSKLDESPFPPDETLQFHVDQIKSNHSDFKVVRERSDTAFVPGTLSTIVCSGVTSAQTEVYYRLILVEFTNDPTAFLVVVQGCSPEIFEQAEPVFQQIIDSIRRPENAPSRHIISPSNG